MKEGPDIARIASLLGDPARANMLLALMSGKALTGAELAREAGVSPSTASGHLKQLSEGALIRVRKEGRHKYFALAGPEVAATLEALEGLAAKKGHMRTRPGPRDPALRHARVCYDHLAGDSGVRMYRTMQDRGCFRLSADGLTLSAVGADFVRDIGLDPEALPKSKAPMCRACLDWSAREHHLAGRLGRAMLEHILDIGWARRRQDSRAIDFTPPGQRAFEARFGRITPL